MRRGKPSCHRAFDEATALLAGDGLLNRAFETMVTADSSLDAATALRLTRELAAAAGFYGMIGGQCVDLEYDGRMPDMETLNELIALKTGALIRAACRMGCVAGGADEAQIHAADTFGARLALPSKFAMICWILRATLRCWAKRRTRTSARVKQHIRL